MAVCQSTRNNLAGALILDFSLQNCENISLCCLAIQPGVFCYGSPGKRIHPPPAVGLGHVTRPGRCPRCCCSVGVACWWAWLAPLRSWAWLAPLRYWASLRAADPGSFRSMQKEEARGSDPNAVCGLGPRLSSAEPQWTLKDNDLGGIKPRDLEIVCYTVQTD